jgi:hypothetical protein
VKAARSVSSCASSVTVAPSSLHSLFTTNVSHFHPILCQTSPPSLLLLLHLSLSLSLSLSLFLPPQLKHNSIPASAVAISVVVTFRMSFRLVSWEQKWDHEFRDLVTSFSQGKTLNPKPDTFNFSTGGTTNSATW